MLTALGQAKEVLRQSIGLSDALMHVNFGLGVFLVVCVLLRHNTRGPLIAFGVVFLVQTLNEMLDFILNFRHHGSASIPDMIIDYIATLFWPAILAIVWAPLKAARKQKSH